MRVGESWAGRPFKRRVGGLWVVSVLVGAAAMWVVPPGSAAAAGTQTVIRVLSSRADLVAGDEAVVEI